jgi:hypothetical protein
MVVVGRTETGKGKNIKIEMLEKQRLLTFWIASVYNAFFKQGIVNSPCSLAWYLHFLRRRLEIPMKKKKTIRIDRKKSEFMKNTL